MAKVDAARRCHAARHPWRDIARDLDTSERTLRHWRRQSPAEPCKRRGRRIYTVPVDQRNEVIRFVHQVTGPCVGLPALRALFAEIPRCVLEDLLRRYRRVWRRRYRRDGYRLEWFEPGRVWAMDHSQASQLVDGSRWQIFAIRDLASHRQLVWLAVSSTDGHEVRVVLEELFLQYGPPLVIKSDNGSAFVAEATRGFLERAGVQALFSPPGYPQYNGQLERSNSINKVYTHQQAVSEGHPQQWTQHNLDAARQLTNRIRRPWGHQGPSPDEAWLAREEITPAERSVFGQEVDAQRTLARLAMHMEIDAEPTPSQVEEIERQAVAGALEALGYVNKTEVKRAPRKRSRPRRQSLERALRQQREARAPSEVDVPGRRSRAARADRVAPTRGAARGPDVPRAALSHDADEDRHPTRTDTAMRAHQRRQLALSKASATMKLVAEAHQARAEAQPTPPTAHRERSKFSCWRKTITLLIWLAKAAKIMR